MPDSVGTAPGILAARQTGPFIHQGRVPAADRESTALGGLALRHVVAGADVLGGQHGDAAVPRSVLGVRRGGSLGRAAERNPESCERTERLVSADDPRAGVTT
jgi:hypothetical protein